MTTLVTVTNVIIIITTSSSSQIMVETDTSKILCKYNYNFDYFWPKNNFVGAASAKVGLELFVRLKVV